MGIRGDRPVTTDDVDKVTRKTVKTFGPVFQATGAVGHGETLVAMYRAADETAKDGYPYILITTTAIVDMRDRSYPRYEIRDLLGITARAGYVRLAFGASSPEAARLLTFYLQGSAPFFEHFYAMLAGAWTFGMGGREFPFAQMENFAQMPPIRFESDLAEPRPAESAPAPAPTVAAAPTRPAIQRPPSKRRRPRDRW